MYYVVGSGPAGVACAHALSAAGRAVTMLDGGVALEPEREAIRASAALKPRPEWTEREMAVLSNRRSGQRRPYAEAGLRLGLSLPSAARRP